MKIFSIVQIVLPGLIFLSLWQFCTHDNARLQFLFASPSLILETAAAELRRPDIWKDFLTTFMEAVLGLLFGTVLGTLCGLLLWADKNIDRIARPYIVLIGSIPVFAVAPVMIMWFGIGLMSKVVMAGFAVYFVSLVQTYEGAHVTASQYLKYARSIGASRFASIVRIIIPGSLRWVFTGFRLNVGFALTGAFIGEFISSEKGVGHYILKASSLYDMPKVFFGLILISIMAMALTFMAGFVKNRHGLPGTEPF